MPAEVVSSKTQLSTSLDLLPLDILFSVATYFADEPFTILSLLVINKNLNANLKSENGMLRFENYWKHMLQNHFIESNSNSFSANQTSYFNQYKAAHLKFHQQYNLTN